MSVYGAPVDIVNRALQILELPRVNSLNDSNPSAQECLFLYDKLRRAMLRRHVWTFATRRVALRPIASTTVLMHPATWVPGTYPSGSIVEYQNIITEISVERHRQVVDKGFSLSHDDNHDCAELARAAASYLLMHSAATHVHGNQWINILRGAADYIWPWNINYRREKVDRRTLVIAAALIADMTDVFKMDDLFCEGFAAYLAKAVQPTLQPNRNDLFTRASTVYRDAIDDATRINAIEMGSVEPPVDSYITCRL